MAQNIEIEFKNLLTKNEFNLLQDQLFESVEQLKQTNYYFETEDLFLKNISSSLRIRSKQNKWTMTLKEPATVGILETDQSLTKQQFQQLIDQPARVQSFSSIARQLQVYDFPFEHLNYYGKLVTFRQTIQQSNGTIIVLDHSMYNNEEDFELEVEGASEKLTKDTFLHILNSFSIEQRQTIPKIARFFTSI